MATSGGWSSAVVASAPTAIPRRHRSRVHAALLADSIARTKPSWGGTLPFAPSVFYGSSPQLASGDEEARRERCGPSLGRFEVDRAPALTANPH